MRITSTRKHLARPLCLGKLKILLSRDRETSRGCTSIPEELRARVAAPGRFFPDKASFHVQHLSNPGEFPRSNLPKESYLLTIALALMVLTKGAGAFSVDRVIAAASLWRGRRVNAESRRAAQLRESGAH